jgi:hypothetical protein
MLSSVSDEPISLSRNGLDENRLLWRIAQSPANLANRRVHASVDVDEHLLAPQAVDDLFARHQLTSPLDEHEQEVHRLLFEPNRTAPATQFVSCDVQLEVAEAKHLAYEWFAHVELPTAADAPSCVYSFRR